MVDTGDFERDLLDRIVQNIKPSKAAIFSGSGYQMSASHGVETGDTELNLDLVEKVVQTQGPVSDKIHKRQLAVPYKDVQGEILGIMYVEIAAPRRLKFRDLAILQGLGRQMVERHWQSSEEIPEDVSPELLADVSRYAKSTLSIVSSVLKPQRLVIIVRLDDTPTIVASRGFDDAKDLSTLPLSLEMLNATWEKGETCHIGDAINDPEYSRFTGVLEHNIRSVCICPLNKLDGEDRGVIYLDSCKDPSEFLTAEVSILKRLALALEKDLAKVLSADPEETSASVLGGSAQSILDEDEYALPDVGAPISPIVKSEPPSTVLQERSLDPQGVKPGQSEFEGLPPYADDDNLESAQLESQPEKGVAPDIKKPEMASVKAVGEIAEPNLESIEQARDFESPTDKILDPPAPIPGEVESGEVSSDDPTRPAIGEVNAVNKLEPTVDESDSSAQIEPDQSSETEPHLASPAVEDLVHPESLQSAVSEQGAEAPAEANQSQTAIDADDEPEQQSFELDEEARKDPVAESFDPTGNDFEDIGEPLAYEELDPNKDLSEPQSEQLTDETADGTAYEELDQTEAHAEPQSEQLTDETADDTAYEELEQTEALAEPQTEQLTDETADDTSYEELDQTEALAEPQTEQLTDETADDTAYEELEQTEDDYQSESENFAGDVDDEEPDETGDRLEVHNETFFDPADELTIEPGRTQTESYAISEVDEFAEESVDLTADQLEVAQDDLQTNLEEEKFDEESVDLTADQLEVAQDDLETNLEEEKFDEDDRDHGLDLEEEESEEDGADVDSYKPQESAVDDDATQEGLEATESLRIVESSPSFSSLSSTSSLVDQDSAELEDDDSDVVTLTVSQDQEQEQDQDQEQEQEQEQEQGFEPVEPTVEETAPALKKPVDVEVDAVRALPVDATVEVSSEVAARALAGVRMAAEARQAAEAAQKAAEEEARRAEETRKAEELRQTLAAESENIAQQESVAEEGSGKQPDFVEPESAESETVRVEPDTGESESIQPEDIETEDAEHESPEFDVEHEEVVPDAEPEDVEPQDLVTEDPEPEELESEELEPEVAEPEDVEPQALVTEDPEPEDLESDELEPEAAESDVSEPEELEPDVAESEEVEPQELVTQDPEPQELESEELEPEAAESDVSEPEELKPEAAEPQEVEPQALVTEDPEPEELEPEAAEPQARSAEPKPRKSHVREEDTVPVETRMQHIEKGLQPVTPAKQASFWERLKWVFSPAAVPNRGGEYSHIHISGKVVIDGQWTGEEPIEVTLKFPSHNLRVILELEKGESDFAYHGRFEGKSPVYFELMIEKPGFSPLKLSKVTFATGDGEPSAKIGEITLLRPR